MANATQKQSRLTAAEVEQYICDHADIESAIENLQEFFGSMPAPSEDGGIPGVDKHFLFHLGQIRSRLAEICKVIDYNMCN